MSKADNYTLNMYKKVKKHVKYKRNLPTYNLFVRIIINTNVNK